VCAHADAACAWPGACRSRCSVHAHSHAHSLHAHSLHAHSLHAHSLERVCPAACSVLVRAALGVLLACGMGLLVVCAFFLLCVFCCGTFSVHFL